jgi:hypothetical protein
MVTEPEGHRDQKACRNQRILIKSKNAPGAGLLRGLPVMGHSRKLDVMAKDKKQVS